MSAIFFPHAFSWSLYLIVLPCNSNCPHFPLASAQYLQSSSSSFPLSTLQTFSCLSSKGLLSMKDKACAQCPCTVHSICILFILHTLHKGDWCVVWQKDRGQVGVRECLVVTDCKGWLVLTVAGPRNYSVCCNYYSCCCWWWRPISHSSCLRVTTSTVITIWSLSTTPPPSTTGDPHMLLECCSSTIILYVCLSFWLLTMDGFST